MPEEPEGYVDLTLKYEFEEEQWVGVCLELSTSTFGDTLEEVQNDLTRLVIEHLNLLEEAGERERFFEEHDISYHEFKSDSVSVTLPLHHQEGHSSAFYQAQSLPIPPRPEPVPA